MRSNIGLWLVPFCVVAVLAVVPARASDGGADASGDPPGELVNQIADMLLNFAKAAEDRMLNFTNALLPAVQRLDEQGKTDQASRLAKFAFDQLGTMGDGSVRFLEQQGKRWIEFFQAHGDDKSAGILIGLLRTLLGEVPAVQHRLQGLLLPYIEQD